MTKQDARYLAQTVAQLTRAVGDNIGRPVEDALALHRIAGSLHRYGERICSVEMSERETARIEKRVENLEAKARAIAAAYGFRAYFQGDCRGCPLYLIPRETPENEDDSTYSSRGHAVPWLD